LISIRFATQSALAPPTFAYALSAEKNKALVRRIFEEVWQEGNVDAIDEYYAADVVNHGAPPDLPPSREGFKVYAGMLTSAFPDADITIEDQVAEGDRVVTRWSSKGIHTGEFFGIPATGKQVTVTGIVIERIAGGKVAEIWAEFDQMGLMQQLGVVPPPG
jgi:steroid delta-isomerase-like uncharacterized protein